LLFVQRQGRCSGHCLLQIRGHRERLGRQAPRLECRSQLINAEQDRRCHLSRLCRCRLARLKSRALRGATQFNRLRKRVRGALLEPFCHLARFASSALRIRRRCKCGIQRGALITAARLRGIEERLWQA
jgi:hypothetical protein